MNNKKATKRALLTSVMALAMCVVMLVGTTFAWFTDTAKTSVNKIQAGKLDIELVKKDGETPLGENDALNWVKAADHENDTVLWEPNCTCELAGFQVKNAGNLAVKYKVVLNATNISVAEDGKSLLDVIDWTVKVGESEPQIVTGNLKDGVVILDDVQLLPEKLSGVISVTGHMDENAGNDYQDMFIDGFGITVYATQATVEYDSKDNLYDKDAPLDFVPVSSAEELEAAFANVKAGEDVNVSLNDDVTINDTAFSALNGGTEVGDIYIQGNGHTLTNNNADSVRGLQIANSTTERTVTISNVNLKLTGTGAGYNAKENRGVQLYGLKNATINLVNCNIDMTATNYSYAVKVINSENLKVNITGCTLTGANCIQNNGMNCVVNITDCVLNSNYNATSTYRGDCINDKNGSNNTYNIKNTTFSGIGGQPFETNSTTKLNNLGGNINSTGNQQVEFFNAN